MLSCKQCGETEFDCLDGLYYCSTCQTQTQDLHVEEDFLASTEFDVSLCVKAKKLKTQSKAEDKGRPWATYEAFTIIIKMQAESLIALGAASRLMDVVFRLWALYLSKIKAAFMKPDTVDKTGQFCRARDRCVPPLSNPDITSRYYPSWRHQHQHYDVGTNSKIYSESEDGDDEGDGDSKHVEEGHGRGGGDAAREGGFPEEAAATDHSRVRAIHMSHTLALCYLGLLYTNPYTPTSDIIRWVQQNKIPFTGVTNLLPSDMKFTDRDQSTFCVQTIPTPDALRQTAGHLARFMHLPSFPPVHLAPFVHTYIRRLSLPTELHGYVRDLLDTLGDQSVTYCPSNIGTVPQYEVTAVAYIIAALWLLLGLNDHTEISLSDASKRLMEFLRHGETLFVFTDWLDAIEKRVARDVSVARVRSVSDVKAMSDLDPYMSHYWRHLSRNNKRHSRLKSESHPQFRDENMAGIQRPFTLLSERWHRGDPKTSGSTKDRSRVAAASVSAESSWPRVADETEGDTVSAVYQRANVSDQGGISVRNVSASNVGATDRRKHVAMRKNDEEAAVLSTIVTTDNSASSSDAGDVSTPQNQRFLEISDNPQEETDVSERRTALKNPEHVSTVSNQNSVNTSGRIDELVGELSEGEKEHRVRSSNGGQSFGIASDDLATSVSGSALGDGTENICKSVTYCEYLTTCVCDEHFREKLLRARRSTLKHFSADLNFISDLSDVDFSEYIAAIEGFRKIRDAGRKMRKGSRKDKTIFSRRVRSTTRQTTNLSGTGSGGVDLEDVMAVVEEMTYIYREHLDKLSDMAVLDVGAVSYFRLLRVCGVTVQRHCNVLDGQVKTILRNWRQLSD